MSRGLNAVLLLGALACADPAGPGPAKEPNLDLRVWMSGTPAELFPGVSVLAYVTVRDRETGALIPEADVVWTSGQPAVVTVQGVRASASAEGPVTAGAVITAVATGTATITARHQGVSASLSVTVVPSLSLIMEGPFWTYLDEGDLLWEGETVELYVHSPTQGRIEDATVVWSVDDPEVATVQGFVGPIRYERQFGTQGGLVTGHSSGTVTVTARVGRATAQARIKVASRPAALRITGPTALVPGSNAHLRLEAQDATTGTWFFAPGATWSTTNPAVVCLGWPYVSQYGATCEGAEARAAGTAVVRAALLGLEASATLTVRPVAEQIVMRDPTAPRALRFTLDGAPPSVYPTTQPVTGGLALSPAARVLAYVCPIGVCIEGQGEGFSNVPSPARSPTWYPTTDGSLQLAYQTDGRTVIIVDFPGGIDGGPREVRRIVTSQHVESPVSPREPGRPFAAQCSGYGIPGFWYICLFGTDGQVGAPLFNGLSPAWGPEGQLAWCDGPCHVRPGPLERDRVVFESSSGFYPDATWSPDGKHLFVVDAGRIYLAATDGSGWSRLPQWTADTGWGDPDVGDVGPRLTPSWR